MTFWQSLWGMVALEVTSGDPAALLRKLDDEKISLFQIEPADALTVRFQALRTNLSRIRSICEKRGDCLKLTGRPGLFWKLNAMRKRPLLLSGLLLILVMMAFLPTRVLFFRVEGNERVPRRKILEAVESCGIRFGASRQAVRSEKMKNTLLEAIPELQWAGINTSGCTAVISVKERSAHPDPEPAEKIYSIVSARDAVITEVTTTRGNGLCVPGQAVKKGQLLISPYTDCGIAIRFSGAEGEIRGQTRRQIQAVMPLETLKIGQTIASERRYSLIIGKKRINLWKDSGIWDTTCGRMYEEYYITLPGGFRLPVCLAVERLTSRRLYPDREDPALQAALLKQYAEALVFRQMIAGKIQSASVQIPEEENRLELSGSYVCEEMIGREKAVKIGETNGENSGEDR